MGGERTSHVVPGSHSRMWAAASSASLRLLGWQAISMSMCSGACCSAAGCGCPGAAGQLSVVHTSLHEHNFSGRGLEIQICRVVFLNESA